MWLTKMIAPFPENTKAPLCEASGEIMGFINRNNVKKLQEIPNQLSESDKQSIYRGVEDLQPKDMNSTRKTAMPLLMLCLLNTKPVTMKE